MTDLQALLDLRLAGWKPASVWLLDWPEPGNPYTPAEPWPADLTHPEIRVHGLTPALVDLRPAQGCRAHVCSDDLRRAIDWVDRLLACGAAIVYTHTGDFATWRP